MTDTKSLPTVSVLIAAYEAEQTIGVAIQSVLEQTFQDFEIVVIDDASTDATPERVREFSDPRIRLEVAPLNRGVSPTYNELIRRARGQFMAFLNCDDAFLPAKLDRQVSFLRRHPGASAVFTMPEFIGDDGTAYTGESPIARSFRSESHSAAGWLRRFFFRFNCLCFPSILVRRAACHHVGMFDPRLHQLQDLDYWVRMSRVGQLIAVLEEPLVRFRIHDSGRNVSARSPATVRRTWWEVTRILRHYRDLPERLFAEVFPECSADDAAGPQDWRLASMVFERDLSPMHRLFALETMHEVLAQDPAPERTKAYIKLTGDAQFR